MRWPCDECTEIELHFKITLSAPVKDHEEDEDEEHGAGQCGSEHRVDELQPGLRLRADRRSRGKHGDAELMQHNVSGFDQTLQGNEINRIQLLLQDSRLIMIQHVHVPKPVQNKLSNKTYAKKMQPTSSRRRRATNFQRMRGVRG